MRLVCPKVGSTRWVSMDDASGWLTKPAVALTTHFDAKRPLYTPYMIWWLFQFFIYWLAQKSVLVFASLQILTTLVSQQMATLLGKIDTYCSMTGWPSHIKSLKCRTSTKRKLRLLAVSSRHKLMLISALLESALGFLNAVETLLEEKTKQLVVAISKLFVKTAHGIKQIVFDRDASKNAWLERRSVFPMQLVQIDLRAFTNMMAR